MTMDSSGRWLGAMVTRRPARTIVLALSLFVATVVGFRDLTFSTDYRIFFSSEDPGLASFDRLEAAFTKTDNILFVVKARSGSIFTNDGLTALQDLTESGWKLPYATRIDSLANFPVLRAGEDDIAQEPLVPKPARALEERELRAIREAAVAEPILFGSLIGKDESTAAVNVTLRLPGLRGDEVNESAAAARALAARARAAHPDLDIRVSGMACMNDAFMHASLRDMAVMIPLMIAVMLIVMALALRSASATAAVATVIFLSATMSMGIAGWLGYPLTPPSVAAPVMVLTVAVADGIHIVHAAMEAIGLGRTRREAAAAAIAENFEAVLYTCATTLVGFLCLNYSDAPPVRHLANMTAFGVAAALLFSVTLLPALLVVLPLGGRVRVCRRASRTGRVVSQVLRHPRKVLAAFVVFGSFAAYEASQLEANDQFVKYFDESLEFRRDTDFTMEHLSGIYRLEYPLGSGAQDGVTTPEYLRDVDRFVTWLRGQPEVQHVYALTDILKSVRRAVRGGGDADYTLPERRDEASQLLLLYEMGLPPGLELTDRIDVDKSTARLSVTVRDMSSREMRGFAARTEAWLRQHTPPAMWARATGPVVIFSELSDRNAESMVQADVISLALISLCMILVLRSVRIGLLSVLPNVLPIVVGYGVWRVAVGQINVVATVAASVSLGIVVDDTIHLLTRFQRQKRDGASAREAVERTLGHVGPAMMAATAVLVFGFGVLTVSAFQMTSSLGWLTALVVAIAPLADLLLMPALLVVFAKPEPSLPHRQPMFLRRSFAAMFVLAVTFASVPAAAETPEEAGALVVKKIAAKNAGYGDLAGDVEMVLRDRTGSESKRRFNIKVMEQPKPDVANYSLVTFDAPADVKGTALLSHAKLEGDDEQWLYMPSVGRVKRVASANKTSSFAGSEFTFEDLTGNDVRKYAWRLLGTEKCGAGDCHRLEGVPKDPASAYSRRVVVVDTTELRVQSVDFFDRKGAHQKTLTYDAYKQLGGKYWRAQKWTMQNHQTGKSTLLSFSSMKMGSGYAAAEFSTGRLGGGR